MNLFVKIRYLKKSFFFRKFKRKPEIVIDLLGILRVITTFDPDKNEVDEDLSKFELLCGGRFLKYQKNCEIFFKKLSNIAKLVFFEDGTVKSEKSSLYIKNSNEKYDEMIKVFDMIDEGLKTCEIIEGIADFPLVTTHLMMVEEIAKKYGKLVITRTRERETEIAKYATENRSFAVLAENSNFLIFKDRWRYFSAKELKISDLSTKEYKKDALWKFLGLDNFYKMAMFAGNDHIDYENVRNFHELITFGQTKSKYRFPAIAEFVQDEMNNQTAKEVIDTLVKKAFEKKNTRNGRFKVKKSIDMYHTVSFYRIGNLTEKYFSKIAKIKQ